MRIIEKKNQQKTTSRSEYQSTNLIYQIYPMYQMIHMNCQVLFSQKKKEELYIYTLGLVKEEYLMIILG